MLLRNIDTWQLIINTLTTIVTFLLVALLQNTQKRADEATQHKLNAIADGMADLMSQLARNHPELLKGTVTNCAGQWGWSNMRAPHPVRDLAEPTPRRGSAR